MGAYRYRLERDLLAGGLWDHLHGGAVCFVMLNPSTADDAEDACDEPGRSLGVR